MRGSCVEWRPHSVRRGALWKGFWEGSSVRDVRTTLRNATAEELAEVQALIEEKIAKARSRKQKGIAGIFEAMGKLKCVQCGKLYDANKTSDELGRTCSWKCSSNFFRDRSNRLEETIEELEAEVQTLRNVSR